MKHSIRQRVLDPVTGLIVTKVETVNGELGSGLFDCNGRELFEHDKVNVFTGFDDEDTYWDVVRFKDGVFILEDTSELLNTADGASVEIIGHVDD